MTKYFKLLNAFRGTRYTYCLTGFTEPNQVYNSDYVYQYRIGGVGLYTAYSIYDNDFHDSDHADLDLLDKASSIIGPEIFNHLKIVISRDNTDLMYQSLIYSFLNCPKIESFGLKYPASQYEEIVFTIRYKHKFGSHQKHYDSNLLEMEYISPAQRYFDLVTTYLKDIEFISFETLQWGRLHDDPVMDLNGFKKLKDFIYSTKGHNGGRDGDFVLIKYTNEEKRRYYPDEMKREQVEYTENPTTTTPCLTIFCDSSVSFIYLCIHIINTI